MTTKRDFCWSVVIFVLGAIVASIIVTPIVYDWAARKTTEQMTKDKEQIQILLPVGSFQAGSIVGPEVSEENRKATQELMEQFNYQAGRALSAAEAWGDVAPIKELQYKIQGNRDAENRMKKRTKDLSIPRPSIQD